MRIHSGRRSRPIVAGLGAALAVAACGPSTPPLSDPAEILQAGAASLGTIDTVHLRGAIDGLLPIDLGGSGGAPLPLDGTTLDADIDVPNAALAVELLAPAILNLRLQLVAVDGVGYLRAPIITGESWARLPAEGGIGGDPGAALEGLAAFLARPDLEPEQLPDRRCAGTDCYSVRFATPAGAILDALGDLGGAIPGLGADAAGEVTVTVGVRRDNLQLATLALDIAAGGPEPLTIAMELSRVNEPVTIEAPPPDEVTESPFGLPGG
jgi:hypothetical protein